MNDISIDVRALAKLAKLEVSDDELSRLEKELPAILAFVETIQEVSEQVTHEEAAHRNVMREDVNPHESGMYTDDLLNAAPTQKDGRIVVKQVLKKK